MGVSDSEIKVYELDCWDHLRNIWLNQVNIVLSKTLMEDLDEQLKDLPPNIRIHTDIIQLLRAVEKECSTSANYAKGSGSELWYFLRRYHPGEYFFPFARACGGTRQDVGLEGSPAVYMNLPFLVAFFNDRLSICSDDLLQKSLYMSLQSVQFIAMLRVLSILYISVGLEL